jgi:biopolymer transport protein ExbD
MTRKQVRAACRRLREQNEEAEEETGEINLVPYLDIITNIIIFLLASVIHNVPLGNVNVSAPTIGASGGASDTPEEKPLNLTVTAANGGFIVAASGGVLPTIPRKPDGQYDYKALTDKLLEIKKEYPNETKATFNADPEIPYTFVVETLDAMREDPGQKPLFPDIVFSAGIL